MIRNYLYYKEMVNFQADIDAVNRIPIVPKLLEVICRTTGMGFAAIARVTEDRWVTCSVRDEILFGLVPGSELKLETTICHEIRQSGNAVVIDHVAESEAFRNHHTPAMYGFQSYISMPIIRQDGTFFGTLCAIDPTPHKLDNIEVTGMFTLFAELISLHLNNMELTAYAEAKLLEEQKTAELREQFIAILGHDLRNPLGAITNCAQLLMRMSVDERTTRIASIIQDSTFRMRGLIENILDFARGRLGEGIILNLTNDDALEIGLNQVITELSLLHPDRRIESSIELLQPVTSDAKRIAQLFSNILSNAITHSPEDTSVKINAITADDNFILSVSNSGEKIPDAALERLFKPFSRGEVKPGQQGLGLGLFIASEIAAAHAGKLEVFTSDEETTFTLTIPVAQEVL